MPADVYLKTTHYPARPYAGPGIPHTQQLVPRARPPTSTNYSITVPVEGPGGGKGRARGEAGKRGLLALPLALGMPPAGTPQLCLESPVGGLCFPVPSCSPVLQKPQRWRGHHSARPQGLGTALVSRHPLLPQRPRSLPIQVLPHRPSWPRRGHSTPRPI